MDRLGSGHVTCVFCVVRAELIYRGSVVAYITAVQLRVKGREWSVSLVNCEV
jgi:hypothetical protein